MDIFISIIIGLGITIIVWLAPIFTGIFGGLMWLPYCFLGGIIPFTGTVFNIPKYYIFISIVISLFFAFQFFKINERHAKTIAISNSSDWAARCQASFATILIISSIISLFIL